MQSDYALGGCQMLARKSELNRVVLIKSIFSSRHRASGSMQQFTGGRMDEL